MSRRTRLSLLVLAACLMLAGVAAWLYLQGDPAVLREQAPLVPTLFVPPT